MKKYHFTSCNVYDMMQWCTSYDMNRLKRKHRPIPSSKMRVSPCHGNPTRAVSQIKFQIWDTSGIIQHHSTSLSGQEKVQWRVLHFHQVCPELNLVVFPLPCLSKGQPKPFLSLHRPPERFIPATMVSCCGCTDAHAGGPSLKGQKKLATAKVKQRGWDKSNMFNPFRPG